MASVQNIVELLFKVSDQASGPSKAITASMDGVKSAALAASAAALAVGGGALYAAKKAVELGTKFEDTSLSIAGALTAFELAPNIEMAEQAAVKALGNIDRMAAKLPGTTEDYVEVFKQGLPAAIAAGATDLDKIADFTSRYTAVATANMVDAQQAGSDLSLMLTGMAGQQVNMWRKLSPLIGKTAEEFNKMTREARMAAIDKSLAGYAGMLQRAGDTMGSKLGEAQAHIEKIARLAGMPLFDALLQELEKMNKYFTENEKTVIETGKHLATTVVNAIKMIADNFETVVAIAKNLLELWVAFKVGVVASEITSGLFAIAAAFNAITVSATEAAAAEAAATAGLSALVGLAVGAASFAGMKYFEGKVEKSYATSGSAFEGREPVSPEMQKALESISAMVSKVAMPMFGQPFLAGLIQPQQIEALKDVAKAYNYFSSTQKEAFAEYVKNLGVELGEVLPKGFKLPKPPGGPRKADVNIENARFDIKQNFAEGYDPDRIAAAFVDQLGAATMYRTQSAFSGQPGTGG